MPPVRRDGVSCSITRDLTRRPVAQICKISLNAYNRRIVNVPRHVWHADHNIGTTDAVIVNFPPRNYDHANPDKYRLPIDTPSFPSNSRRGHRVTEVTAGPSIRRIIANTL